MHVGHSHLPKNFKKLAILDFCSDEEYLFGRIKQRFLEMPRKLIVSDLVENSSDQLLLTVTPKNNRIESDPLEIDLLVDRNESSDETEVLISFDGGSNFYTMEKKTSRISNACRNEIRKARIL